MRQFVFPTTIKYPAAVATLFFLLAAVSLAQSTLQEFPTAVLSNQINGTIAPRPVGDPRNTTHYYYFNGGQGDLFINVVSENFAGDIDIFVADGLRLMTRVVLLADAEPTETGRVVYLRKPEKLLLRVQGRTPNDEPAKYQIKFAGGFIAINEADAIEAPELPTVPKRVPAEERAAVVERPKEDPETDTEPERAEERRAEPDPAAGARVVVTPEPKTDRERVTERRTESERRSRRDRREERPEERPTEPEEEPEAKTEPAVKEPEKPVAEPRSASKVPREIEALANFSLVILFKDGSQVRRPMTEVNRFSIERGILLVFGKDGRIGRYSMADVERVGIEQ